LFLPRATLNDFQAVLLWLKCGERKAPAADGGRYKGGRTQGQEGHDLSCPYIPTSTLA